jgi:hypothetical protein
MGEMTPIPVMTTLLSSISLQYLNLQRYVFGPSGENPFATFPCFWPQIAPETFFIRVKKTIFVPITQNCYVEKNLPADHEGVGVEDGRAPA